MRASATMATTLLFILFLCDAAPTVNAKLSALRVRNLMQMESRQAENPRTGLYQNPCTGSWSNDAQVLTIDDCDAYLGGGGSGNTGDRNPDDDELDCNINSADDPTSMETIYPVEFWYGVKATTNDTDWLPKLEKKIYEVGIGQLERCIGHSVRRHLLQAHEARRLGILGTTSAPADEVREDVRMPGAYVDTDNESFVVQGMFQVLARENDDLTNTLAAIQNAIEDSMTSDELLGEDLPNVTDVIYLGKSQEDVENQYILPPVIAPPVLKSANPEDDDDDDSAIPIIIAASATGFVALILLLFWRQKRAVATREKGVSIDDDGSFSPLPGTGDPSGSFHHGVYHYFRDGQSYLSTNCYDCHETRLLSNSDYGGVLLPVSDCSDDEYYQKLVQANSKDIGGNHSGMNVQNCASSTCKLCRPFSKSVEIIPFERKSSVVSPIVYPAEEPPDLEASSTAEF